MSVPIIYSGKLTQYVLKQSSLGAAIKIAEPSIARVKVKIFLAGITPIISGYNSMIAVWFQNDPPAKGGLSGIDGLHLYTNWVYPNLTPTGTGPTPIAPAVCCTNAYSPIVMTEDDGIELVRGAVWAAASQDNDIPIWVQETFKK